MRKDLRLSEHPVEEVTQLLVAELGLKLRSFQLYFFHLPHMTLLFSPGDFGGHVGQSEGQL